jgi:Dyp-type peroxidase family
MIQEISTIKNHPKTIPLHDIQGLIIRGYRVPIFRNFICTIKNAAKAKIIIDKMTNGEEGIPQITSAKIPENLIEKPSYFLNISFTFEGLKKMKLDGIGNLNKEFRSFPSFKNGAVAQAEYVGDTGESAPENWKADLNNIDSTHVIVVLYARNIEVMKDQSIALRKLFLGGLEVVDTLDGLTPPDGKIHFGYKDGISQPTINAVNAPKRIPDGLQPPMEPYKLFLTGDNDDPTDPSPYMIPDGIGENGSFGAFRILEQDVKGFDEYLNSQSDKIDPELLAAKFCGRWRNGDPLELTPDTSTGIVKPSEINNFNYNQATDSGPDDFLGSRCPIGSHMRRANPRDATVASPVDNHRVMRRAMSYGKPYDPNNPDDETERGLIGYFIGASIQNNFEFIMSHWFNDSTFAPDLPFESTDPYIVGSKDPLLGANKAKTSVFDIPTDTHGKRIEVKAFPRFITTKGSAYCFFPGINALKTMVGM